MNYLQGLGMLTFSAVSPALRPQQSSDGTFTTPTTFQTAFFFVSLYMVSFAQGGHKPCVQAFGADQFDDNEFAERKRKTSFFNWWYFGMCFSTVFTVAGLSYIQDNIGWGFGFGIPCAAMALALIIFLLGTKTYRFPVTINQPRLPASDECQFDIEKEKEKEEKENNFWAVLKLFPIWATCLIYAVVFAQSGTFFTKQGGTIDRRIGATFEVPPAALQSFICLSIVIFIPIYDRVLVPFLRKLTDTPFGITMLQRIGTGIFLSVISMVTAALVEIKRLKIIKEYKVIDSPEIMVPMSFLWLIPQYIIYGMADTFTMVGLQEFFYDQVPDGLRSFGLALYLSIFGIGSFMSSVLVSVIDNVSRRGGGESWFSDNLNRAHLDYFYWLLAGLSAIQFIIYIFISKCYVYKKKNI